MFRKLMVSTAMATLIASGVYAQTTTEPSAPAPAPTETAPADPNVQAVQPAEGHLASNLIGETVYSGTGEQAQNIGSVNDLVVDSQGQVQAVVVGVGGFLGIGQKNVALEYNTIDWAEENGDRWIVVSATKEQLEALPEFDPTPYEPAPAVAMTDPAAQPSDDGMAPADDMAAAPTAPATPPADSSAEAPAEAPADSMAQAPADTGATAPDQTETAAIDRSRLTEVPAGEIRAEDLIGTTVYGADDANVGEIGDVVMTADGQIDAIIIDVGGFLGVGEKEVAVGMDNLVFMADQDGNRYLYTQFTKEQLDAAPTYDTSTWAEKRDEQRLTIQ